MASRLAVMSSRMAVCGQQPVCDGDDAARRRGRPPAQGVGVLGGVDVVGHDADAQLVGQRAAQRGDQRGLAACRPVRRCRRGASAARAVDARRGGSWSRSWLVDVVADAHGRGACCQDAKSAHSGRDWSSASDVRDGADVAGRSLRAARSAGRRASATPVDLAAEVGERAAVTSNGSSAEQAQRRPRRPGDRARAPRPARPRRRIPAGGCDRAPERDRRATGGPARRAGRDGRSGPAGRASRSSARALRPEAPRAARASGVRASRRGRRAPSQRIRRGRRRAAATRRRPRRRRRPGPRSAAGRAGTPPGTATSWTRPSATAASRPSVCAWPPSGNRPSASRSSAASPGVVTLRRGSSAGPSAARWPGPARWCRRRP